MANPGIGDPYWYEWYVGLEKLVEMLSPSSDISYVTFQSGLYDTIDDVVVGYENQGQEVCYQVKHEVSTSNKNNLTFGKLLEKQRDSGKCLIDALSTGWKDAKKLSDKQITPVLYTNKALGPNKTSRTFDEQTYTALPLGCFLQTIKSKLESEPSMDTVTFSESERDLELQWIELHSSIDSESCNTFAEFLMALEIRDSMPSFEESEQKMKDMLMAIFACSESVAHELLTKLIAGLNEWTTTRRKSEKVTIEDVCTTLGTESDINEGQHRLSPPYPFFESKNSFCKTLCKQLSTTNKKLVFLSGEPGSGKTSIISHLQAKYDLFLIRYQNAAKEPYLHYYRDRDAKEIDLLIEGDGKLCPIEIKKTTLPDKRLTRVFSVVEKSPLELGVGAVLCMADQLSAFDKDNLIVPIWMI